MSDTGLILPGQPAPADPTDPLTPPDDFGAEVVAQFAQFEKRGKALAAAANDTSPAVPAGTELPALPADGPPGGFPSANDANDRATIRVDVSQAGQQGAGTEVPGQPAPATPSGPAGGDASATGQEGVPAAGTDASASQVPGEVPGGVPGGAGQSEEGADAAAVPPPSGFTYRYHDGQQERTQVIPDEMVNRALGVAVWAENLAPEVRTAIGAIEAGQAVAIPRSDYDQFVAWQNTQNKATRDADLDALDLDDAARAAFVKQRDEIDALKAQMGQTGQQPYVDPALQARVNAGAEQDARDFAAAQAAYATSRGLSPEEVEGLLDVAVRSGIIPNLVEQANVYNPANGQLMQRANIGQVAQQALDWALVQNPQLASKSIASAQARTANGVQQGTPLPGQQPAQPALDPVAQRKARAASLATAPSGTTPAPPAQKVQAMTSQEVTNAMAAEIEAVLRS